MAIWSTRISSLPCFVNQVRSDLHTFGFRPDLSRRSLASRIAISGDRQHMRQSVESVAIDTVETATESSSTERDEISPLVSVGLQSFQFFAMAFHANDAVAEHILAACVYERSESIMDLISGALGAFYRSTPGYHLDDTWAAAVMVRLTCFMPPLCHCSCLTVMLVEMAGVQNCCCGAG